MIDDEIHAHDLLDSQLLRLLNNHSIFVEEHADVNAVVMDYFLIIALCCFLFSLYSLNSLILNSYSYVS